VGAGLRTWRGNRAGAGHAAETVMGPTASCVHFWFFGNRRRPIKLGSSRAQLQIRGQGSVDSLLLQLRLFYHRPIITGVLSHTSSPCHVRPAIPLSFLNDRFFSGAGTPPTLNPKILLLALPPPLRPTAPSAVPRRTLAWKPARGRRGWEEDKILHES
jgi:hypothetical protein